MKTRKVVKVTATFQMSLPENVSDQGTELQEVEEQLRRLIGLADFPLNRAKVVSAEVAPNTPPEF